MAKNFLPIDDKFHRMSSAAPQLKKSMPQKSFSDLAFGDGTPKKAFLTALIVGTILTTINHGDVILAGQWPPFIKVFLTFCVPYCVTTWGAITGKKAEMRKQAKAMAGDNQPLGQS